MTPLFHRNIRKIEWHRGWLLKIDSILVSIILKQGISLEFLDLLQFYLTSWKFCHTFSTAVILTKEASHLCRFVPGTNWYKWASQIVNFTLIHHLSLSDKMAWPVVSVCSLVYEHLFPHVCHLKKTVTKFNLHAYQIFLRFFL